MNKKTLIIIGIILIVAAFIAVLVSFSRKSSDGNQQNTNQQVEPLTPVQEDSLKIYIKNFLELYNSYEAANDFKNLITLDSDMTLALRQENLARIDHLRSSTQAGFSVKTTMDENTLVYSRQSETRIEADIQGQVVEGGIRDSASYKITARVVLIKESGQWYFDDVEIIKLP
jgi:hypothetical protein